MLPIATPSGRIRPFFLLLLLVLALAGLGSCTDTCETTITYTVQEPIQMRRSEMIGAVASLPARPLTVTGKIYAKDHLVFVNEPYQGIHVIDNHNPAAPKALAFISIPGNVDMAIRDHILYADAGPDLLALDISDPARVVVKKHIFNTFLSNFTWNGIQATATTGSLIDNIPVGFNTRTIVSTVPCGPNQGIGVANDGRMGNWGVFNSQTASFADSKSAGGSTGTGGSMARFTITGNYLYAINPSLMRVFNISSPASPELGNVIQIGGGIETVFPYQDKLFIGSMSGMFIYDISNGATPAYLGRYSHITRCDPVVVSGDYAYVTLRSNPGGMCGTGNSNQLDVVDISNPRSPQLKKTFPMQSPYGLGIDRNTLFVCEGDYGLKVFDALNPLQVGSKQIAHFQDINMFDVIPLGSTLLAVGSDGLYQYDYSDPKNIRFLSKIPVGKR
jgi:hypothetical protein